MGQVNDSSCPQGALQNAELSTTAEGFGFSYGKAEVEG
jgi:hypothetical protein